MPDAVRRFDVVVVGGGPAGLSAALVLGRCTRRVLVVDDGQPRNAPAEALHGFLTRDGIPPLELLRIAREELARYGVRVRDGRVISARAADGPRPGFEVTVENGELLRCRKLLLATGVKDTVPAVEGMLPYYGRGVHHCPYCDGWEARGGRLAAYGAAPASPALGLHLLTWSSDVTVLTDGVSVEPGSRERLERNGVRLVEEPVARLEGDGPDGGSLTAVVLRSGERLPLDALFFASARVQHSDLPALLGCELEEGGEVRVRGAQRTGVPGLYLAGDADGDVQFAVVAAAEGARAAVAINQDLEKEDLL